MSIWYLLELIAGLSNTASSISKYQIVSCPDRGVRKYSTDRGSYHEKPRGVEENLADRK
jgi:hypothetical protein